MSGMSLATERESGRSLMEAKQYFVAMAAFCVQRSKMQGENELFWLAEADLLKRLAINAERRRKLAVQHPSNGLAA